MIVGGDVPGHQGGGGGCPGPSSDAPVEIKSFKRKLWSTGFDIIDDSAEPGPESLTNAACPSPQAVDLHTENEMSSSSVTAAEVFAKLRLEIRALWGRVHDLEFQEYPDTGRVYQLEQRVFNLEKFAIAAQKKFHVVRERRSRHDGTDAA